MFEQKDRYNFAIAALNPVLKREKGIECAFVVMDSDTASQLSRASDNHGCTLVPGDWYVVATCENGYKYYINVSCDSVVTMCAEVLSLLQHK